MSTVGQLDSGTGGTQSPGPPPPTTNGNSLEKKKTKKDGKRKGRAAVDEMTAEEREAVTIVFHQYETGLREGTIFTKVSFTKMFRITLKLIWVHFISWTGDKENQWRLETANFVSCFPESTFCVYSEIVPYLFKIESSFDFWEVLNYYFSFLHI